MIDTRQWVTTTLVLATVAVMACQPSDRADETATGHVVEVTATEYAFDAPLEIPSGWTTFRMKNAGEQEHFLVLWPLPEGKMLENYKNEILTPFEQATKAYRAGTVDRAGLMENLGAQLPEWFAYAIKGAGGPGLTAPGRTAQTTVQLRPGNYVMECYVRTPDGDYHSMLGMIRSLTVTDEASGAPPPTANIEMTLANYDIETTGDLTAGTHTVRVQVIENPEGLLPHDIHLARLNAETSVAQVVRWMDWVDELRAGAPAEFIGGVEQMPAGHTGYFTIDLTPGRYLWISESYGPQGMVEEFVVQ